MAVSIATSRQKIPSLPRQSGTGSRKADNTLRNGLATHARAKARSKSSSGITVAAASRQRGDGLPPSGARPRDCPWRYESPDGSHRQGERDHWRARWFCRSRHRSGTTGQVDWPALCHSRSDDAGARDERCRFLGLDSPSFQVLSIRNAPQIQKAFASISPPGALTACGE